MCALNDVCIDSYRKFECSGIARTSLLLGHSMGTLHLYELAREVQKLMGDLGESSSRKFRNFTVSQVGSEAMYRSKVSHLQQTRV